MMHSEQFSEFHFSNSNWPDESMQIHQIDIPLPEQPYVKGLFSGQKFNEGKHYAISESPTADSMVSFALETHTSHESADSYVTLGNDSKQRRQGTTQQSNSQKILMLTTKAHPTKNLPAEMFRKIKNFLKEVNRTDLLNGKKKRFSVTQLNEFITNSRLEVEEWEEILDLGKINAQIEKSKKLGTSKHYDNISGELSDFLIYLNKEVQKIVYRSAKRVIMQLLRGDKFASYLDSEGHKELHSLDEKMSSGKYSSQYEHFLSQLRKSMKKTQNQL